MASSPERLAYYKAHRKQRADKVRESRRRKQREMLSAERAAWLLSEEGKS